MLTYYSWVVFMIKKKPAEVMKFQAAHQKVRESTLTFDNKKQQPFISYNMHNSIKKAHDNSIPHRMIPYTFVEDKF